MTKYVIYARKSTDTEDKQIHSIEDQLAVLREYADKHQLQVVQEFVERKTAKKPGRKIFNDMISSIKNGLADGILAFSPDRLSRNPIDSGTVSWLLTTGDIKDLQFPTQSFSNDPGGKFMLNIGFAQGQQYIEHLSINTKRGLSQKAKRGEFPGKAPLGYKNDRNSHTIMVDKSVAEKVARAFELYSTGDYGLRQIGKWLFDNGVTSQNGKVINVDSIKVMLSNIFYIGLFKYCGEIYEGKHKPLISQQLFDKCQQVMNSRGYSKHQPQVKHHPFIGLLTCSECGMAITATTVRKTQKNGNQHEWTYYHCTKKNKTLPCSQKPIRQEVIDEQLTKFLQSCTLTPEAADYIKIKAHADYEMSAREVDKVAAELQSELDSIKTRLNKLTDMYMEDLIDKSEMMQRKQKLVLKRRELEVKMNSKSATLNNWLKPLLQFVETAENLGEIANSSDLEAKSTACKNIAGSNLSLAREKVRYARPKKAKNKARSAFESLAAAARETDDYGAEWTFNRYEQECRGWGLEPKLSKSDKPENRLKLSEFYKVSG